MNEPSVKVLNCTVSLDLFYTQLVQPWLNSSDLCNLNSLISRVGDNDLVLCVRGHVPGVVELTLPVAPAAKRAQVLAHDGENLKKSRNFAIFGGGVSAKVLFIVEQKLTA